MNAAKPIESGHPSGKDGLVAAAAPFAILALVVLMAFTNAWPNRLVFDDKAFAGPGRAAELNSVQYIFTHDVWAPLGTKTGLYRPLLLLDLSVETQMFGGWLAGYHLGNILMHLLVTFLVYGFLHYLLRKTDHTSSSSRLYALLAASIFAVHPIHAEVVNSVFNRSEMMVSLFGLGGLLWLLNHLDEHRVKAWVGLAIAYFLAMLSKESAVIIPGLAVVLILLFTTGDMISRIRKCLPVFWLLISLAIYLAMRTYALSLPELESVTKSSGGAEISALLNTVDTPDSDTLLSVIGFFGESLKVFAWPYPLKIYYDHPSTLMLWAYLALNLVLIVTALVQLRRGHYGLAAGLGFFYLALLPASRIIGGGDSGPHFAERYMYFPSVGLTLILAFGMRALAQGFSSRLLIGITMPVLLVLTAVNWDRNADWISEASLFEREYQRGQRDIHTLRWVASANLTARNFGRVVKICDESLEMQEKNGNSTFVQTCSSAYESQGRIEEAIRAHQFAIGRKSTRIPASMSLARLYIRYDRPADAEKQFKNAIAWTEDPADKALFTAEMIIALNPRGREQGIIARGHVEEALSLRPGWPEAERMLQVLDRALNPPIKPEQTGDGDVQPPYRRPGENP